MPINRQIIQDQNFLLGSLSVEENRMALECARKVRIHLEKAFLRNQQPHFLDNLGLVDQIIEGHQRYLQQNAR